MLMVVFGCCDAIVDIVVGSCSVLVLVVGAKLLSLLVGTVGNIEFYVWSLREKHGLDGFSVCDSTVRSRKMGK